MSDLGDLLELLYGARSRYRTLHASVRDWQHLERSRLAMERDLERLKVEGYGVGSVSIETGGPAAAPAAGSPRVRRDGARA